VRKLDRDDLSRGVDSGIGEREGMAGRRSALGVWTPEIAS